MEKVREELEELDQARHSDNQDEIEEELGDLLFSMGSLARHLGIDPESALRRAALKFESRFGQVENRVRAQGRPWQDWRLEELEDLWQQAKTDLASSDR